MKKTTRKSPLVNSRGWQITDKYVRFDGRELTLQGNTIPVSSRGAMRRALTDFIEAHGVEAVPFLLNAIADVCELEESEFDGVSGEIEVLATDDELPTRERERAARAATDLQCDAENFSEWKVRCRDAAAQ